MAATTYVSIVKYASDNTTILAQVNNVTYQWMEANLPVYGDGVTHYYHQGPTFDDLNIWDPGETINILSRDMGAAVGTDVKDLCNLVGGMEEGEWVEIRATDNFNKKFDYDDVYEPEPELGRMVLAWNNPTFGGYVPSYSSGMRLIFLANTTNATGLHVFGNWDMHETLASNRWYFYDGSWPSSSGLSVTDVDRIRIYSNDPAPVHANFSANTVSGYAPLAVQFTDLSTGAPTSWAWDFENDGTVDSTARNASHTYSAAGTYTVNLTVSNAGGSDAAIKADYINVQAAPAYTTLFNVSADTYIQQESPTVNYGTSTYLDVRKTTQNGYTRRTFLYFNLSSLPAGYPITSATLHLYKPSTTESANQAIHRVTSAWSESTLTWDTRPTFNNTASFNLVKSDWITPEWTDWDVTGDVRAITAGEANYGWMIKFASETPLASTRFSRYAPKEYPNPSFVPFLEIVSSTPLPPVAVFSANRTSGSAPLAVVFTDSSSGDDITSWAWDFENDGTVDSTVQNPGHSYSLAGNYTVKLTVANAGGSNTLVRNNYINVTAAPVTMNTLFNGTVTLTPNTTFTRTAYNSGTNYTVNRTTPLGALDVAAGTAGFTYNVTDKRWSYDQVLLLDDLDGYLRNSPGNWLAYVNGAYKDGYGNHANGLNVIQLSDGDRVDYYYAAGVANKSDLAETLSKATAGVKIIADIPSAPTYNVLFEGTVTLAPNTTFTKTAYNSGTSYTVNRTTPLGALDVAAGTAGFTYNVTDKRWSYDQVLLLDDLDGYLRNSPGNWLAYVNGAYKDGYGNHANGLNVIQLSDGDRVDYYYAAGVANKSDLAETLSKATAAVKLEANIDGSSPPVQDWSLALSGARTQTVTKSYFEQGLACPSSGHMVSYTDPTGNEWAGVPLWLLVAMVDDNPDSGPDHFNFNDALATQGYSVKVTAGDSYTVNFESAAIARNNSYIVANTLNGTALPELRPNTTKPCFPLQLIGPAVTSGKLIGNITSIELTGLPEPSEGWTLTMEGDVVDVITQQYFEEGIACHHNTTYTDGSGNVWSGVPLWDLAGAVDDIETSSHWTFNDTRAGAGYTLRVIAGDGYNKTFASTAVARNSNYIVANIKNGLPLTGTEAPLRLVGTNATGGKSVGCVTAIRLEGLPAFPAGDWSLQLDGAIGDTIPQPEFEYWATCHSASYTDGSGNVYEGVPLWRLLGWVDDRIPHGSNGFNNALANAGYKVIVTAGDGYSKEFTSQQIGTTNGFIVANRMNGQPLSTDGSHPPYPLRLVGAGLPSASDSVGNIVRIELTDFQQPAEVPAINIIKYAADGLTIINQTTVDHVWLEANLPVVGDGTTHYLFQGLTMDPADLWDPNETKGMNPPKIDNAIKGTKVRDLCDLVGGMESGTEIKFIATDGYETTLPYDSIYTNPHVYSHLGDTIIAWYADGQYVPQYTSGPRLFFAPEDHVAGQWNMHEALPEQYWHYNWADGIQYPSIAGLSARNVETIEIYAAAVPDWTVVLDGEAIGGLNRTIGRNYFESALACQFGANHKASYTDSQGRTWEGMPLWFLCGFVDDADQHSDAAYNDTKALSGYNITIMASDDYQYTFNSKDTVRNANYIVANTLNGTRIAEEDSSWPLRLVGQNVTGSKVVKKIASVTLEPIESPPPAEQALYIDPSTRMVANSTTATYEVRITSLPDGLAGYDLKVTIDNPAIAEIVDVQYPGWAVLNMTTPPPPSDELVLSAIDIGRQVGAGAGDTLLAILTIRTYATGSANITLANATIDADGGDYVIPSEIIGAQVTSYIPLVADFEANETTGKISSGNPFNVGFTDLSTGEGISSWAWDFDNNGVVDSTIQNPVHSYTSPGNYTVKLAVQNALTTDTEVKSDYIRLTRSVKAFPDQTNDPTDPDGDFLYEDINGNGRLDYDDIVMFFENMQWIRNQTDIGIEPYDFNHNGRIDYDDVVLLYVELLDSHP